MSIMNKSYVAVGLLCFINLINYMDRYTVAGVLPSIKSYYELNDSQGGLLQTAFIVSYMIMAPLFGYLGDRYSRKYLMGFGVLFWSLTTFLGSCIPKGAPGWFFIMRALVGTGEASYSTIAPTIIGDLFISTERTRMLAAFYFAIPVGSGLGYIVGTQLQTAFNDWKYALRLTPILGIISVVLMLVFLEEPPRGHADGVQKMERSDLKSDLLYLTTVKSYIWSTIGFTCVCFTVGSLAWWAPTYMNYVFKALDGEDHLTGVTLIFGVITCLAGILGVLIGTLGAQWYRERTSKADPLICSFSVFLAMPFIFISLLLASSVPALTWICISIGVTLLCVNWTLVADMLLYIIVPHRRALAQSLQILASHLLGDATSPYIVGAISDAIRGSKTFTSADMGNSISLQYSLYINCFVLVLGGLAFLYTSAHISRDQEICKATIQADLSRKRNAGHDSTSFEPEKYESEAMRITTNGSSYNAN